VPVVVVQAPASNPAPVVTPSAAPPVEQAVAAPTEQSVEQAAAVAAARAAALHPFPAAVSEGLAPVPEAAPAPPSKSPAEITDTLSYVAPANALDASPGTPATATGRKKASSAGSASAGQATTDPAQSAPRHDFVHALGRFFKKLFGG
jgi:hypothetical protein